jgi:hypothetical protein
MLDLKKKRQQELSFLLRHDRIFPVGRIGQNASTLTGEADLQSSGAADRSRGSFEPATA